MSETQAHANYTMVEADPAGNVPVSQLSQAAGYGIGVLLAAGGDHWSVTRSQIAPYINAIIGFLVLDDADVQPDWNAAKAQVEAAASAIHADYPNAHILINLAGASRNIPNFTLPAGVDWVGLECYGGVPDCDDMLTQVIPKLPPNGRVWILPPGETDYGTESWLVSNAQAMYDWAITKSAIMGLNVFVWESQLLAPTPALATRDLPSLRVKYCQIGRTITGRGSPAACQ